MKQIKGLSSKLSRNEVGLLVVFLLLIGIHIGSVINQSLSNLSADSAAKASHVPEISPLVDELQLTDEQGFSRLFDITPRVVIEDSNESISKAELTLGEMEVKLIAVAIVGEGFKVKVSYMLDGETIFKNVQLNELLFDYTLSEITLNRVSFSSEKGDLVLQMFKSHQETDS